MHTREFVPKWTIFENMLALFIIPNINTQKLRSGSSSSSEAWMAKLFGNNVWRGEITQLFVEHENRHRCSACRASNWAASEFVHVDICPRVCRRRASVCEYTIHTQPNLSPRWRRTSYAQRCRNINNRTTSVTPSSSSSSWSYGRLNTKQAIKTVTIAFSMLVSFSSARFGST